MFSIERLADIKYLRYIENILKCMLYTLNDCSDGLLASLKTYRSVVDDAVDFDKT